MDRRTVKAELAKLGLKPNAQGQFKKSDIRKVVQAENWLVDPSAYKELNDLADRFKGKLMLVANQAAKKDPSVGKLIGAFEKAWDDLMEKLGEGHFNKKSE